MRTSVWVCALVLGCWALQGCCCDDKKTGQTAVETPKAYNCPACKDKVTWMYNSKGLPTGFKKVEHTCPSCKKAWGANVSSANACGECAKAEKMCPTCMAKGG